MGYQTLVMLGMVLVPRLLWASQLGPLTELGWIGTAVTGIGYLMGSGNIVWAGYHAVGAYRNRDEEGVGKVFMWMFIAAGGAVLLGSIIPGWVDPILARGETL